MSGTFLCTRHSLMSRPRGELWSEIGSALWGTNLLRLLKGTLDYCAERIWYPTCSSDGIRVMVFNATFNNSSAISGRSVLFVEKTIDLPQITGKLDHIMMYRVHLVLAGFELTYAMVFSMFKEFRWELIVRFVDFVGNVDLEIIARIVVFNIHKTLIYFRPKSVVSSNPAETRCTRYIIMW